MADIIDNTGEDEVNIFYTEAKLDYTVTSAAQGDGTDHSLDTQSVATALESEIVPNVVQQMLSMYPTFKYMGSANIGIGLKLYSNVSTNVAASVTSGSSYSKAGDGNLSSYVQTYTLSVNMAKVGDLTKPEDRSQLESTIAHEMTQAFMFESMTNGMLNRDEDKRFPLWFVEGTAQTAGGGLDWVKTGLRIDGTPTENEIKVALDAHPLTNADDSAAIYGAGYLATLYLGFVAGAEDPTNAAVSNDNLEIRTAKGLNKLLAKVIGGQSLSAAIAEATGNRYSDTDNFVGNFSNDAGGFIKNLLDKAGAGRGSLIRGDFSEEDLVPNGQPTVKINLFTVDKDHTEVANTYPVTDHNSIEGGNATAAGVKPEASYNPGTIDAHTRIDPTNQPAESYPADLFTITDKSGNPLTLGTDYEFDTATGVLTILKPTAGGYKISGGSKTDSQGRVLTGRIVIDASAVVATETDRTFDVTLDGVTIDQSAKAGACAVAIKGSDSDDTACVVNVTVTHDTTLQSGADAAGRWMVTPTFPSRPRPIWWSKAAQERRASVWAMRAKWLGM